MRVRIINCGAVLKGLVALLLRFGVSCQVNRTYLVVAKEKPYILVGPAVVTTPLDLVDVLIQDCVLPIARQVSDGFFRPTSSLRFGSATSAGQLKAIVASMSKTKYMACLCPFRCWFRRNGFLCV